VCRSPDPRDTRLRSSLYVRGSAGERVVIDTGPDFRVQALRAGIHHLDAVLLTHSHADHLHGIDDLRIAGAERPLPVYANKETLQDLRERFSYIFHETPQVGGGKPTLNLIEVERAALAIGALTLTPIPVKHGVLDILGWRISEERKSALYITDESEIPETSRVLLGGADVCVIDGLRERLHSTHFSFEQALNAAVETGARQVYLTHICHDHSHREIEAYCQAFQKARELPGVWSPAYDGLAIDL
jgi:phosphoribosyl 1,2-cyclic phosphate phosphodiesterase